MEGLQRAVLVVATAIVVVGLGAVVWRELQPRHGSAAGSPTRRVVEVLLPVAATVALLVWLWQAW